jgi:2-oxoglutarate ferredoxin oxidoreductase subunit alpha
MESVRNSIDRPERVYLANRFDGVFITHTDIRNIIRVIQGKGA